MSLVEFWIKFHWNIFPNIFLLSLTIDSGNGLLPSGNKPWTNADHILDTAWCQWATIRSEQTDWYVWNAYKKKVFCLDTNFTGSCFLGANHISTLASVKVKTWCWTGIAFSYDDLVCWRMCAPPCLSELNHRGRKTHIGNKLDHHWWRWWLVVCHYVNQSSIIGPLGINFSEILNKI